MAQQDHFHSGKQRGVIFGSILCGACGIWPISPERILRDRLLPTEEHNNAVNVRRQLANLPPYFGTSSSRQKNTASFHATAYQNPSEIEHYGEDVPHHQSDSGPLPTGSPAALFTQSQLLRDKRPCSGSLDQAYSRWPEHCPTQSHEQLGQTDRFTRISLCNTAETQRSNVTLPGRRWNSMPFEPPLPAHPMNNSSVSSRPRGIRTAVSDDPHEFISCDGQQQQSHCLQHGKTDVWLNTSCESNRQPGEYSRIESNDPSTNRTDGTGFSVLSLRSLSTTHDGLRHQQWENKY